MMYEPSFYTTESYKQGGNHNSSIIHHMYFTKDHQQKEPLPQSANGPRSNMALGGIIGEDEEMLQSYTNASENKKGNNRTSTSTKKSLKVKRSDSNGS